MPFTRITNGQVGRRRPAAGSRRRGRAGRVGDRGGHGQHAAVADGPFQQGGPAVEIGQHHARRRPAAAPTPNSGTPEACPRGSRWRRRRNRPRIGMFQRPAGRGRRRRPAARACRSSLPGNNRCAAGTLNESTGVGVAAEEDGHAVALGGVIGQLLPDRRLQRRRVEQAHGRKAVQRLARQARPGRSTWQSKRARPCLRRNRRRQAPWRGTAPARRRAWRRRSGPARAASLRR